MTSSHFTTAKRTQRKCQFKIEATQKEIFEIFIFQKKKFYKIVSSLFLLVASQHKGDEKCFATSKGAALVKMSKQTVVGPVHVSLRTSHCWTEYCLDKGFIFRVQMLNKFVGIYYQGEKTRLFAHWN